MPITKIKGWEKLMISSFKKIIRLQNFESNFYISYIFRAKLSYYFVNFTKFILIKINPISFSMDFRPLRCVRTSKFLFIQPKTGSISYLRQR